jgi:hypothetical protein
MSSNVYAIAECEQALASAQCIKLDWRLAQLKKHPAHPICLRHPASVVWQEHPAKAARARIHETAHRDHLTGSHLANNGG